MSTDDTVAMPAIKIASAWGAAFGIASWSDVAAALAAVYTLLLIGEWVYKKLRKPNVRTK